MSEFFAPAPPSAVPEPIPTLVTSSGQERSPGPAGYTTRRGPLEDVPRTYMHRRHSAREDVNIAPYRDIGTCIGKGKKYTFKGRYEDKIADGPGPDYTPPAFGTGSRAYTVHIKTREPKKDVTPGPGQYEEKRKIGGAPKHTFHGPKDRAPPVIGESPGPAAYTPRMPPNRPTAPRYSVGRRYAESARDVTPGPGAYNVPDPIKPNTNKGKIHDRLASDYSTNGPGPAEYTTTRSIISSTPKVYMHARTEQKQEVNTAPYRNTRRSISETPKYSMRGKYFLNGDETPGVEYVPPDFGKDGRKLAISPRYKDKAGDVTPGPDQYRPKTTRELGNARKSTFHGPKDRTFGQGTLSPGPAEYTPDFHPTKSRSPRFTIKGSKYDPQKDQTGGYVDLGTTLKGPRYSMRPRPSLGVCYG